MNNLRRLCRTVCLFLVLTTAAAQADQGLLILTSSNIYAALYGHLTNFAAHKEEMGFTVFIRTVEDAVAEVSPATHMSLYDSVLTTNDPADQIRAFLRASYTNLGYHYLLLIGDPDPDDYIDPGDTVGDVPMKMTYAVGTADWASASTWYVPTDCFYRELSTDWDKNNNGLFAEWNGDRGSGGMSLDHCELTVGRIPCYSSLDYSAVIHVLQKTIAYETDHPTNFCSWRYTAFQPNPIDWSDSYGAEGNVSPIFMAENLRTNYFKPNGIHSTRIYEDNYTYYPWDFDPTDIVPEPRAYICFTHYYSWFLFKAIFNSSSDNYADYETGIETLTDEDFSTTYSNTFNSGHWLQFRLARDDNRAYAPARMELYAPALSNLPRKLTISMAKFGDFAHLNDPYQVVTDDDVWSRAAWDSDTTNYMVRYDCADGSLTRVGQRKYIRVKYTGGEAQSVVLSQFKAYTFEHKNIKPYVTNVWFNQGFGSVVFCTHGSHTYTMDIITSSETAELQDDQPGLVFLKACQTGWAEDADNLAFALLKNGAIGSLGATRTSWGFSEHGHVMFFKHVVTNVTYGDALRLTGEELESVNYYNWDGNYSDVFRFNLYGDPTVRMNFVYPSFGDLLINGEHNCTSTCVMVDLSMIVATNELSVTEMQIANRRDGLTNAWQAFVSPASWLLDPEFEQWHTVYVQVKNEGGLVSPVISERVFLIPEPCALFVPAFLLFGVVSKIRRLRI